MTKKLDMINISMKLIQTLLSGQEFHLKECHIDDSFILKKTLLNICIKGFFSDLLTRKVSRGGFISVLLNSISQKAPTNNQ